MDAVLGDGLSSELGCWMEACVARVTIRNAGEFNGFLKPNVRLFSEPLGFVAGELVLPSGFTPTIDAHPLAAHETRSEEHTSELQSHLNLVCRLLLEKKTKYHTP